MNGGVTLLTELPIEYYSLKRCINKAHTVEQAILIYDSAINILYQLVTADEITFECFKAERLSIDNILIDFKEE